jgi:beta-glucosidase
MVILAGGYISGDFPPGEKRGYDQIVKPTRILLRSHARMYHALHEAASRAGHPVRVGFAQHLREFEADRAYMLFDHFGASLVDRLWNWALLDAAESGVARISLPGILSWEEEIAGLKGTQDFIGINYYSGDQIQIGLFDFKPKVGLSASRAKTDLNWDIYPRGIYKVIMATAKRYPGKPIVISENGIADASDRNRQVFLRDHLYYVERAIREGAPVEGYCHWSLLDNWEWKSGYDARFGLYAVDFKNESRKLRESGEFFRGVIGRNGLDLNVRSGAPFRDRAGNLLQPERLTEQDAFKD